MNSNVETLAYEVTTLQKKTGKKYVIYTCVTNGYSDVVPVPEILRTTFEFILFSDISYNIDGWNNILFKPFHSDHRRSAKFFKILPHKILSAFEASIWIDGNFELRPALNELFEKFLTADYVLSLFQHRKRNCVYEEGVECLRWGKDVPHVINQQLMEYKILGHPEHWGLFMGGFLIRKHNLITCQMVMQDWWNSVELHSVRDQLSLPVVLRQHKLLFSIYPYKEAANYFVIRPHLKYRSYALTGRNLINPRALIAPLIYVLTCALSRIRKTLRRI